MLSLTKCKKIIKDINPKLTDEELLKLRDTLYLLADLDYLVYLKTGKPKNAIVYHRCLSKKINTVERKRLQEKLNCCAEHQQLNIIRHFEDANTKKNEEFNTMLEFVSESQNKVDFIIFYNWGQIILDTTEIFNLIECLKQQDIVLLWADKPLNLELPEGELALSFYFDPIDIKC